jgi:hypothetical protein
VLELIADRFRTDEVIRYEAALCGNAAYLTSLDAPTRQGIRHRAPKARNVAAEAT